MATSFYSLLLLPFFSFLIFLPSADCSISFEITRFEPDTPNLLYHGDAIAQDGAVKFNKVNYVWRIGWVTYAERVPLWDSTGKLTDFATHFSFTIDNQNRPISGHGMSFFLAPVGFEIPPNSGGSYLGLFNTTTSNSTQNQIVLVEFDSYASPEWDPNFTHVGINNNSLASSVYTSWNVTLHSGDTADVWITYNATTQNLSVSWMYQTTHSSQENSSLFYQIDLMKVLPQWVTVGFSAATGTGVNLERHILKSWKFRSSLNITEKRGKGMNRSLVAATVFGGVLISGVIIAFAVLWRRKQKKSLRRKQNSSQTEGKMNLTSVNDLEREAGPKKFSYRDLVSATNNFSIDKKLGEGGFGVVFKGYLNDIDMAIAVKKFSKGSKQGKREYITEVKIISMLRHRNLVRLIGWCHEKGEFLLVYEFMPKGSLDSHLFDNKSLLTWAVRYKIALGLASGLLYLHEEGEQYVVHRDIKSSNVMLDSSFNAKLGDFGLARLMDYELGPRTTGLAGTLGYMAPEYIYSGRASKESDVFSFGMVALEIATGKKSVDTMERKSLLEWVWEMYGTGKLLLAVDETLNIAFDMKQAECLMIVGLWCAHLDSSMRPSIRQAIQVLNFDAEMPNLPTEMPIPTYRIPTKLDHGVEISISSSSSRRL